MYIWPRRQTLKSAIFVTDFRDLDIWSGHTAYSRLSVINLCLHTRFHWNWKNFLWTDIYMYGWVGEVDLPPPPTRRSTGVQSSTERTVQCRHYQRTNSLISGAEHTTVDHDISDRTSAAGLETVGWVCRCRCLDSPRWQACQVGKTGCSPNIRRPQNRTQTHGRCFSWDRYWAGVPSQHDTHIWNKSRNPFSCTRTHQLQHL